jgi:RecA-family ATPase
VSDITNIDLLDYRGLLSLPDPQWLITDILPEGDYSVLWGPSGQGKSFVALDWAVCLALGIPWQGRYPVPRQCPVIYIAAEGGRGMKKRARALAEKHGVSDIPGLYFLIEPLYVREPGVVEAFLEELEARDIFPGLVIIDTLSRSFGGGEENASADMGKFIEAITHIAKERCMTALILHHSNATGGRERGHTSLKGGANAMFSCLGLKSDKGHLQAVTLEIQKQKDDINADAIYLRAEPRRTSLTLEWEPTPEKAPKGGKHPPTPMRKEDMLSTLGNSEDGYTWKEWKLASKVPKDMFNRRIRQLTLSGDIYKEGAHYYATPSTGDLADDE